MLLYSLMEERKNIYSCAACSIWSVAMETTTHTHTKKINIVVIL